MIPVDQTRMHDPASGLAGNCAQAAVASLLDLDLEQVPDFTEGMLVDDQNPSAFWQRFDEFFMGRGLLAYIVNADLGLDCLHLASGLSPRGVAHMVVRKGFEVVHDPHPSRAGLVAVTLVRLIIPLDITQWFKSDPEKHALVEMAPEAARNLARMLQNYADDGEVRLS